VSIVVCEAFELDNDVSGYTLPVAELSRPPNKTFPKAFPNPAAPLDELPL
jgi:hypothetical protein